MYSVADAEAQAKAMPITTAVKVGLAMIPLVYALTRDAKLTAMIVAAHMVLHHVL